MMGEICHHGGIRVKCEICERDKEIIVLKIRNESLNRKIDFLQRRIKKLRRLTDAKEI